MNIQGSNCKSNVSTILIVDDHPVSRDGLATRIAMESDLEVCGEAADVVDALKVIETCRPTLAIIDISLETGNGLELVKEVKARFPKVRMLVWSMFDESLYAERAVQAGAMGYVNKKNVRETMIEAIRTVLNGNVYLNPTYVSKMLNRLGHGVGMEARSPADALSDRELEAFSLIGQGLKTAEIALRMNLTPNTIETYRARIKEKLELKHSAELARAAAQWVLENG
jgi:DNA-binding NarL/FixJ family response regulator